MQQAHVLSSLRGDAADTSQIVQYSKLGIGAIVFEASQPTSFQDLCASIQHAQVYIAHQNIHSQIKTHAYINVLRQKNKTRHAATHAFHTIYLVGYLLANARQLRSLVSLSNATS